MNDKEMIKITEKAVRRNEDNVAVMVDLLNQEQAELQKAMIEEMAKDLIGVTGMRVVNGAKYLYKELNYRKLPEDSVVLTREEYEELLEIKNRVGKLWSIFIKVLEQERKDTAEEFAKAIIDKFNCGKLSIEDDEDIEIHLTASELFELAKQVGILIKE